LRDSPRCVADVVGSEVDFIPGAGIIFMAVLPAPP